MAKQRGAEINEYRRAVDELQGIVRQLAAPLGDSVGTLARMRRLRFKSPAKTVEVTAILREAVEAVGTTAAQYNLKGVAEQFRQIEAAAAVAARGTE